MKTNYSLIQALRPFSFSVALVLCTTGILAASADGYFKPELAGITLLIGLLLQAGVNLINDYSDLDLLTGTGQQAARKKIIYHYRLGLGCFLIAILLDIYLISVSGVALLWISITGVIGALGYTLEPINYKRRGLAVVLVFFIMGVLMVIASYYALAQHIPISIALISIPVSFFTSLLLLSNEIRDYESDIAANIKTLTVRIGYWQATVLYQLIVALIFISTGLLYWQGLLPDISWIILFSLIAVISPIKLLYQKKSSQKKLPPKTGLAFLVFGILYCFIVANAV